MDLKTDQPLCPSLDVADGAAIVRSLIAWHVETRPGLPMRLDLSAASRGDFVEELRRLRRVEQSAERVRAAGQELVASGEAIMDRQWRLINDLWRLVATCGLAGLLGGFLIGLLP